MTNYEKVIKRLNEAVDFKENNFICSDGHTIELTHNSLIKFNGVRVSISSGLGDVEDLRIFKQIKDLVDARKFEFKNSEDRAKKQRDDKILELL